jgi:hypothetical protein
MRQRTISVKTGNSKSGISGATVVGAVLGHKASGRAIGRTIFNSSKRNYTRNKTVWECGGCGGFAKKAKVVAVPKPEPVKTIAENTTSVVSPEPVKGSKVVNFFTNLIGWFAYNTFIAYLVTIPLLLISGDGVDMQVMAELLIAGWLMGWIFRKFYAFFAYFFKS